MLGRPFTRGVSRLARPFSFGSDVRLYHRLAYYNKARLLQKRVAQEPQNIVLFKEYLEVLAEAGQYQKLYAEYAQRSLTDPNFKNSQADYFAQRRFVAEAYSRGPQSNGSFLSRNYFMGTIGAIIAVVVVFQTLAYWYKESAKSESKDGKASSGKSRSPSFDIRINIFSEGTQPGDFKPERNVKQKFGDVIGIDEFRNELEDIVDYLKNPKKYTSVGASFPKGILIAGPPGTGKTLIARAIAGEAGCAFFYASGSQFDGMYRGSGKDNVKALFKAAKAHSPAIVFIDELDSLAGKRDMQGNRNSINQLLTELDGFQKSDNVIFIAATNMEDSIDPAVLRSGRIDKTIRIPLPDIKGRQKILDYYISKIKAEHQDAAVMAKRTIGFSGADLKNYVNTAVIRAVREGKAQAAAEDFDFAYDRIQMGIRRKNPLLNFEKRRETAFRQVGQALVAYLTEGSKKFYKVTILRSGNSLGFISLMPTKDELSASRRNIVAQVDVGMAGMAAEEVFFGNERTTTANSKELEKAANVAYFYVRDMGMENEMMFLNSKAENMSDTYKFKSDQIVQNMLHSSLDRTKQLISKNRSRVELIVKHLLEKETLTYEEFEQLFKTGHLIHK